MYNKSEIMKEAWNKFRTGYYATFGSALCQAWREAKRVVEEIRQGYVTVTELNVGDTIAVSGYGGYSDNSFNTVITGIEPYKIYGCEKEFIVIRFGKPEHKDNICVETTEMIKRIVQGNAGADTAA